MSGSTHDEDWRDAGPTELAAFQAALARLAPAEGINIAQLLFDAGRLSVPRRSWLWPCSTAAALMLATALGAGLLFRPAPQPTEQIVHVYVQPPTPPAEPPERISPSIDEMPEVQPSASDGDYLQLRREVLAKGLDALPPPTPWPDITTASEVELPAEVPQRSRELWFLRLKRSLKSGDAS